MYNPALPPSARFMDPAERIRTHFAESARLEAGRSRSARPRNSACGGPPHRMPPRRRQDPGLRQRRLGMRCPALRGGNGRALRARAAGTSGDLACHRHLDPDRSGQRLCVRADLREAGARAGRQGRRAARHLDVGQLAQRDRRDRSRARSRHAGGRADRARTAAASPRSSARTTSTCAFRTSARPVSRKSTC